MDALKFSSFHGLGEALRSNVSIPPEAGIKRTSPSFPHWFKRPSTMGATVYRHIWIYTV